MRILYGISSDGLGHTMRARVVAGHLVALGHDVRFATAGRAAGILRDHGFRVVSLDGYVDEALERATGFRPELVITDASCFARLVAELAGAPLLFVEFTRARGTRGARAGSCSRARRGSS